MHIMDMTLRQILNLIPQHPIYTITLVIALDNVLAVACMKAGWTKAGTFFKQASVFLFSLISQWKGSVKTTDVVPVSPAQAKALLLCLMIGLSLTGCASFNQKAVCLQISSPNASFPGGTATGSGYACYFSCVGKYCGKPDSQTIMTLMTSELTATNNKIITQGASIITVSPVK